MNFSSNDQSAEKSRYFPMDSSISTREERYVAGASADEAAHDRVAVRDHERGLLEEITSLRSQAASYTGTTDPAMAAGAGSPRNPLSAWPLQRPRRQMSYRVKTGA